MNWLELLERFGLPLLIIVAGGAFVERRVWPWVTDYIAARQAQAEMALEKAQGTLEDTLRQMTVIFERYTVEQREAESARRVNDAQSSALLETILDRVELLDSKLDRINGGISDG